MLRLEVNWALCYNNADYERIETVMELPNIVRTILTRLNKGGYEAYVVGGCVRDYLMGIKPHDYDITTSALPQQVKSLFKHTVDTGIQHGTVTVVENGECFEVTTFRVDGEYKDNRHPESVSFTDKLSGDLSRRDFTVNAIAYSPNSGFVDMFGGMEDIKSRVIRGVGEPDLRFKEDALRMMRALRFSAQLDFDIEDKTLEAVSDNAELIKNISVERIREELFKLLLSENNDRLKLMYNSGLLDYIIPQLKAVLAEAGDELYSRLNSLSKNIALRLAYLFGNLGGAEVKNVLKELRTDNKTIKLAALLADNRAYCVGDSYSMRRLINKGGENTELLIEYIGMVQQISTEPLYNMYREIIESGDCCSIKALCVNGKDMQAVGAVGKRTGELLESCLDYVMREPKRNNREDLLKFAKEMIG